MSDSSKDRDLLRQEAETIAEYLVHRRPSSILVDRYIAGATKFFPPDDNTLDASIRLFIVAHPSSIRYLDAAFALFSSKNKLRKKILLMVTILETTPEYCEEFFEAASTRTGFLFSVIAIGTRTLTKAIIGMVLNAWIRLRRT
jgi:hypothetical protein